MNLLRRRVPTLSSILLCSAYLRSICEESSRAEMTSTAQPKVASNFRASKSISRLSSVRVLESAM